MNMKKPALTICLIIISLTLLSTATFVQAMAPASAITRLNEPASGSTTTTTLTITLPEVPQKGNVIIAVLGVELSGNSLSYMFPQITQQDVTWLDSSTSLTSSSSTSINSIKILAGIVDSDSASKTVTFTLTPHDGTVTSIKAVATLCEYSGLDVSYIKAHFSDRFSGNPGNSKTPDTDTTQQTRYTNELWIGGTMLNNNAQSSPTNGFMLFDGKLSNGISVGYLEKIVTSTGQAQVSTTGDGKARWYATLATIPAAPSITFSTYAGPQGTVVTMTGKGFAVDSPITATWDATALTLSSSTTTDSNGGFTTTFTVPSTTINTHTVTAIDDQATSAAVSFTVAPDFVLPESPIAAFSAILAFVGALLVCTRARKVKHKTQAK
jgi:hypothetical protein